MEANTKQQQLTYEKGITNVPSDLLCSDNALEYADGMIYRDGEHHVIQAPRIFINDVTASGGGGSFTLQNLSVIYIHKYNDSERYLYLRDDNGTKDILWGTKAGTTITIVNNLQVEGSSSSVIFSGEVKISSIGKTLIVADNQGLHYFLWKDNNYTSEYKGIPAPDVEFMLTGINEPENVVDTAGARGSWLEEHDGIYYDVLPQHQNDWNNLIVGLHSKNKKDLHQKKRFWGTFAIRVALKLYDGTYANISNPIIMFNKFQMTRLAYVPLEPIVQMGMRGQELKYKINSDYTQWKDLVSEIVIFVSQEAEIFDTASDAIIEYYTSGSGYCISSNSKNNVNGSVSGENYKVLNNIEDEAVKNIVENGVFYKLCSIGVKQTDSWESVDSNITTTLLDNITTQEQLGSDDFYGHTQYIPDYLYSYNSRLNIANVSRSIFEGFSYFLPYDDSSPNDYVIYVKIATDDGYRVVKKTFSTVQKQGIWFYYPDPRASHVTIKKNDSCILDVDLREHPALNGAFYFKGNLTANDDEPSGATQTIFDRDINTTPETLPNYIIQSEVNNPFVYNAAGYFKVGTGKILAMSTITQALSEGQFGQFPLLVFSESGIWTLSVASTGYYSSINPMSREVSVDPACIVQTDGAVFFVSKKGLMVVEGNRVMCVSEQLKGKTGSLVSNMGDFDDFLATSFIAYDYRDSLLWIFKGGSGSRYCYVYSIKNGTYSTYDFGENIVIERVVNNYPDYLLQKKSDHYVFSLTNRENINDDDTHYSTRLISRPLKLENALALKTITQLRHIGQFNAGQASVLTLRISASNNLNNWTELHSLRGRPWKYYRFQYNFTNLKATDTFAGSVLITQERRTDKLR